MWTSVKQMELKNVEAEETTVVMMNTPDASSEGLVSLQRTPAMKRRAIGRPTKYTPATTKTICDAVADGTPLKYAAALGGISHETLCQWQRRYPEFSDAIQNAIGKGIQARLKLINHAAENGDVRAAQWWLEHVVPEHFAKTRIQLEHVGQIEHSFVIPQETMNQIAEARRKYESRTEADRT
jgi:hypothetical protein